MNRRNILSLTAFTAIMLASAPGSAFAKHNRLERHLVGTWILESYDAIGADGVRTPFLSATPKGTLVFDRTGHYVQVYVSPDRPKNFTGTRDKITADEYKSAASGLIAQFGTWSVDEQTKTLTAKVDGALNPALAGTEITITISITGHELKEMQTNSGVTGTNTELTFKRAK